MERPLAEHNAGITLHLDRQWQHQAPYSLGRTVSGNVDTYACKLLEELFCRFHIHPSMATQPFSKRTEKALKQAIIFSDILIFTCY
ncbi:MAG: hypothetical protein ABSA75_05290 [Candidatus Bathyarchaeia archaeon]